MTLKLCDMSEREEHVLGFNGFIQLPKSTLRNKSRTFGEKKSNFIFTSYKINLD